MAGYGRTEDLPFRPSRVIRRGRSRRGPWIAAALLLAGLVTSCRPSAPPLRVGVPAWLPTEFASVARDLGFFDDREIALVEYRSPIELARHFREGSLDAAALPLDFAPYLAASIRSLDVVFVIDVSQGADDLVATSAVGGLAGLRGRRVGAEASPLGAHMLLRALKAGGLAVRDIETVPLDAEDQFDAFKAGKVDAVVTHEPDRTRLLAARASSLFDSTRIPGQIVDVLLVPSSVVPERAETLRKLIDGWLAAYSKLGNDRAATLARLAAGTSLDVATVERALSVSRLGDLTLNREMLGGSSPRLASTLKDVEALAVGAGLLRADHPGGVRFNDSLLPRVVAPSLAGLPEAVSR